LNEPTNHSHPILDLYCCREGVLTDDFPFLVIWFCSSQRKVLLYGVATISRMLKNIGLFCKRALQKRPVFWNETCILKHPTNRSHPIGIRKWSRATRCNTLQLNAMLCNTLQQHTTAHCNTMQEPATLDQTNTLQLSATHCKSLQLTAILCNTLQQTVGIRNICNIGLDKNNATHCCNSLQLTATLCNSLQHTATRCNTQQESAAMDKTKTLQLSTTHCNPLKPSATLCNTMQESAARTATLCNSLQHNATHYNTLQEFAILDKTRTLQLTATHCNPLHLTATLCNTLQHLQHTAGVRNTGQDQHALEQQRIAEHILEPATSRSTEPILHNCHRLPCAVLDTRIPTPPHSHTP